MTKTGKEQRMQKQIFTAVLIGCCAISVPLYGQNSDEQQILAVADEFFTALGNRDRQALEAITVPGSLNISTSLTSNGETRLSSLGYEELIAALSRPGTTAIERYWDATVLVQGSIAVFWAPYDFHVDGEFSHCGIDSFQLIKQDGIWFISNLSWTRELENCPESPLGPID